LIIEKEFDTVPHQRLLFKLTQLGISAKVLAWRQFLYVRTMLEWTSEAVDPSDQWSSSRIGPRAFLLYVNVTPEKKYNARVKSKSLIKF